MHPYTLAEAAKAHGTEVGTASAHSRGLDEWDDRALHAAITAERLYIARHTQPKKESVA